ncbi:MAG: T9SS type A sorting domain-containing protein, partial [Acidobacteriota bacterium]
LHAHSISSMASIGNDLFAATETGGVFLSSDKGENWKAVNKGLKDKCINTLAAMGDELFAGSDTSGFFKSTDHGLNWREINYGSPKYFNHDSYWSITALAVSGSNLVACATGGMGIYVSTDHGENWFYAKTDSTFFPDARILAVMGDTLFTGNQHGNIHISTDRGLNWKIIKYPYSDAYISDMAVLDSILFVASDFWPARTTDCGSTWSQVIIVPGKRWQYSFAVYQNYIYAGTDKGEIYLSANNGTSWLKVAWGMPAPIGKLFIHDGNFYAATTGNGVWKYPLQEIISSIKEPSFKSGLMHFSLGQNYPNPFNPSTKISYSIPNESFVELKIFDMLGREVASLVNNVQPKGEYNVEFNASDLTSGVYIYSIQTGEFRASKKLLLVK